MFKKRYGIIGVVLLITVISLVMAISGGQGKAKGNSCMAQCMGVNAESYDASNDLTQVCMEQCKVGIGQGACLTTEDDCCVPYTDDPDCITYPKCKSDDDCNRSEFCQFSGGQCDVPDLIGTCTRYDVLCNPQLDPVCGCDGRTYTNDCVRQQQQAQLDYEGRCARLQYASGPECSSTGNLYGQGTHTWQEADASCGNCNEGGNNDWRLPTEAELLEDCQYVIGMTIPGEELWSSTYKGFYVYPIYAKMRNDGTACGSYGAMTGPNRASYICARP